MSQTRHFFSGFFRDFKKSYKSPPKWPPRIDEYGRFLAWPFVFVLAKSAVIPEMLVLCSLCCGALFSAGMMLGGIQTAPFAITLLILLRATLDCADGALARYSRQVSSLGGLADVTVDFASTVFLFTAVAYCLIVFEYAEPKSVLPLASLAFFLNLCVTTLTSLVSARIHAGKDFDPRAFIAGPSNDRAHDRSYTRFFRLLHRVFAYTWQPVSQLVVPLCPWLRKKKAIPGWIEHAFSFGGCGAHLLFLALIVSLQLSLWWFVIMEFAIAAALLLLTLLLSLPSLFVAATRGVRVP